MPAPGQSAAATNGSSADMLNDAAKMTLPSSSAIDPTVSLHTLTGIVVAMALTVMLGQLASGSLGSLPSVTPAPAASLRDITITGTTVNVNGKRRIKTLVTSDILADEALQEVACTSEVWRSSGLLIRFRDGISAPLRSCTACHLDTRYKIGHASSGQCSRTCYRLSRPDSVCPCPNQHGSSRG